MVPIEITNQGNVFKAPIVILYVKTFEHLWDIISHIYNSYMYCKGKWIEWKQWATEYEDSICINLKKLKKTFYKV